MRYAPVALVISSLCLGCGSSISSSVGLHINLSPSFTYYHALGDSITAGSSLADPASQSYAAILSKATSLPLSDQAVSGDQACDLPQDQIFSRGESPSLSQRGLYSVLVSTNDADVKGTGAYEAVFNLCQRAVIGWLALPLEYKVLASSPSVTVAGATHLETFWNALTTDAPGASESFPITLSAAGPVYVWYRITDGSVGAFSYSVDGVVAGSLTSGTVPTLSTQHGTASSLAFFRIPPIPPGTHVIAFTQTSLGSSGMGLVAVGAPPAIGVNALPKVLVGTTPKQNSQDSAPCTVNDAICQAYIADIRGNIALFSSDGLDVSVFETRKYELGTDADMNDEVHPNVLGHLEIFHAIEDVLLP